MTIRVAQVSTGNAGRLTLRQLIADDRFELVAVSTSTPEKVGRDAGELAGVDTVTGIAAVGDLRRADRGAAGVRRLLRDGRHPPGRGHQRRTQAARGRHRRRRLGARHAAVPLGHDAAEGDRQGRGSRPGGRRQRSTSPGVDPGFASDLVPLALASTCQRIEQIRCYELADYATYDGAEVMFDLMGFGGPVDATPLLFLPGVLGLAWGTAIRMMATGLGIEVDEIVEHWEAEPAPESYDIAAGRIEKGTIAALKFSISGLVAGHPAIVVEHVTRTRDDLRPDWARPAAGGGSYRVEITGEPSYVVDVVPSSEHGDHNHAAIVAACGRIVNAIPDVRAAAPGIRTTLDLPLPTGRGTYVAPSRR